MRSFLMVQCIAPFLVMTIIHYLFILLKVLKIVAIIQIDAFKCNKCGYVWTSNKFHLDKLPISCAKCKSAYWNR